MKQTHTKYQIHWLIFFAGLVFFLINLSPEFIAFQTRFALFAQEMMRHGIKLFPYTYQGPYPDYPVLPTLLIYFFSLPFHQVTPFTAVLPTAIISSLILVFTYQIGQTQSPRFGLYAVLFLLLTQSFVAASRDISMDQATSLITIISFYLIYSSSLYQKTGRLYWIPLLLILGFLFRGPIGIVIPAGVIVTFLLITRDIKKCLLISILSLIILALMISLLLLAAHYEHGATFMQQVINMEFLGRLTSADNKHHLLFYWIQGLGNYAIAYPIAILLIAFQWKKIQQVLFKNSGTNYAKLIAYCTFWLLIIMIGMSIPTSKKMRYILAIAPACSLIAASLFEPETETTWILRLQKVVLILVTILALCTIAGATAAVILNRLKGWHLHFTLAFIISWIIGCAGLLSPFFVRTTQQRNITLLSIGALALLFINAGILGPINYASEKTKPFTDKIYRIVQGNPDPIIFYNIGPDDEDIKFMVNYPKPFIPSFLLSQQALINYKSPAYFVALESDFKQLPNNTLQTKVLSRGKLGHRPALLFTCKPN